MENSITITPAILYSIIATLFSIVLILIGFVWQVTVKERIKKLEGDVETLKPKVQSLEDNHGNGLKRLEEKIEFMRAEFLGKISEVKDMVHKEKNTENQLNNTLKLILEELNERKDKRERA